MSTSRDDRRIHGGEPVDLQKRYTDFEKCVASFAFTPVIGAECPVMGREQTSAWGELAFRIAGLKKRGLSYKEEQYLDTLAKEYNCKASAGSHNGGRLVASIPALDSLRVQLIQLGAHATKAFGAQMAESTTAVTDAAKYVLELPYYEFPEMIHNLVRACLDAYEIKESSERDPLFDADGVFLNLVSLTNMITEGHLPRGIVETIDHPQMGEVVAAIGAADGPPSRPGKVHLYQLEWIADLLWYILRYDVSVYPRNEEMAFQVALRQPDDRFLRPELPDAAERDKTGCGQLCEWLRHYGSMAAANPKMTEFYRVMAQYLGRQFISWRSKKTPAPIGVSTTLDLELERALDRCEHVERFHVVVPVTLLYEPGDDEIAPPVDWLLGTSRRGEDLGDPDWEWCPDTYESVKERLEGPLVVKVHGSPLHCLPDSTVLKPRSPEHRDREFYEHSFVLSESQYLVDIVPPRSQARWPDFLRMTLNDSSRKVFFLGHSVGEWNTRLRIYEEAFKGNDTPTNPRFVAVNERFDPYRTEVLAYFGVSRWRGKLEAVAERILKAMGT
jgi:hypothetical protein